MLFASATLLSQKEIAHVYGQLKDEVTKKRLDDVVVMVFKDGTLKDNINTGTSGKYDIELELGYTYDIKFSKAGFLQKIIRIDSRNIPEEERYGGFQFPMDGTLFPEREGFNTDLLKEPLALIKYDPQNDGLNYDADYSEERRKKIAAEHKRLDDLAKNYEKLKKQFDELMMEGDKKMAEVKYADAMNKYQLALDIFPKDEVAKSKYNDAKARYDAENANKEFEAKYNQLMADADKNFKDQRYEEAKKKYQEAIKMKPSEKAPKEREYECIQALKELEKRKEYDAIIADADKKFGNKDYATSIEKYKEASAKLPNEAYPKDQIVKAELALKAMLDDEATRLAKRKEYESKIELAERNVEEDNLEKAISAFKEASFILPEEKLPGERITELEKILADRKKQANDKLANDNSEKERKLKEYNDLIKIADDFFIAEKLQDSREKYVAALEIMPDENYPKSRIERIDLLLNQGNSDLAKLRQKAIEDSLQAVRLASMDEFSRKKAVLQAKADEQTAARKLYLEEQRASAYKKVNTTKEKSWSSQVDEQAEDEVEQYYRDAKKKEDDARNNEVRQRILENNAFHARKSSSQEELIAQRENGIENQRQLIAKTGQKAEVLYQGNVTSVEQKKKDEEKRQGDSKKNADNKINRNQADVEKAQKNQNQLSQNDRQRSLRIAENETTKEKAKKNAEDAERHGDVLRKDNQNTIEKIQKEQDELTFNGEEIRKEKQDEIAQTIKNQQKSNDDKSKAAYERLKNASMEVDSQKADAREQNEKNKSITTDKANAIAKQKSELELQRMEKQVEETQRHFERRKELYEKANGPPEDGSIDTTEPLAEGVTENSYKLGNKMITERTVTIGNKVNTYKKVVSKTAIYYFKNGKSITEVTWKMETLSND